MQTSYHWKPVLSREWYREAATFLWEPHFWIYLCHKEIVIDYLTSLAQHLIFFWDEWKLYQQILFCEQGLPILSGKRILRRNPKKNLTWREIQSDVLGQKICRAPSTRCRTAEPPNAKLRDDFREKPEKNPTMRSNSNWDGFFCLRCIREKEVGVVEDLGTIRRRRGRRRMFFLPRRDGASIAPYSFHSSYAPASCCCYCSLCALAWHLYSRGTAGLL